MSRALLQKLQKILLYGLYGARMDHRDWMVPQVVRFVSGKQKPTPVSATSGSHEPGRQATLSTEIAFDGSELWFDYLADTGDGGTAAESVALLACSEYEVAALKRHDRVTAPPAGVSALPPGQFLLIGGDTAYHVADVVTLGERFRPPFNAASATSKTRSTSPAGATPGRPLFAIPGNHDYYDSLIGFNKQFRAPLNVGAGPLAVDGYVTMQEASYLAIALPFGWELWALDAQEGDVDFRQGEFFKRRRKAVQKLVLITPEPAVVFGRYLGHGGAGREKYRAGIAKLGLNPDNPLENLTARLDLAGDVHHYARHVADGEGSTGGAPRSTSYASVVAGGGGAFLHPNHTGVAEGRPVKDSPTPLKVAALAPSMAESRKATRAKPWKLGWGVSVLGALLGAAIACVVTRSPSVCSASTSLPLLEAVATFCPDPVSWADVPIWAGVAFFSALLAGIFLLVAVSVDVAGKDLAKDAEKLKRQRFWAALLAIPAVAIVGGWLGGGDAPDWLETHLLLACTLALFAAGALRVRLNQRWDGLREKMIMRGEQNGVLGKSLRGDQLTWAGLVVFAGLAAAVVKAATVSSLMIDTLLWLVGGFLVALVLFARSANQHVRDRLVRATLLGAAHALVHVIVALAVTGWVAGQWSWLYAPPLGAAVAGLVTTPIIFTVYLWAASAAGLHFNELGAATRSENFKQLLRFRVTEESLECFVLHVADTKVFLASQTDGNPRGNPDLVDYFKVA